MTLKEQLKEMKKGCDIALLSLTADSEIRCRQYKNCASEIPKYLLEAEVMEVNEEEDCTEIWIL